MKRLVPALMVGLVCLSSACSEEDAAAWLDGRLGLTVGKAAEDVSSAAASRRTALDGSELGLARAFFPELVPRPGPSKPEPAKLLRVSLQTDGMEIDTRGRTFHVRRLSGEGRSIWQPVDGTGSDGLWMTSRLEEFVVTRAGAAPY